MSESIDKLNKILDKWEAELKKEYSVAVALEKTKWELESIRRKRILHESDKQIGDIVRKLKIKISRDNLFMDDITREELK